MPKITAEADISYSADFIYDFCEKPENLASISDFIKTCAVIGQDPDDGQDIVKMEFNVPAKLRAAAYAFVGDISSVTGKVIRNKDNKSITVTRIEGPFKELTLSFTFNSVSVDKTRVSMDVDFTAGGTGWADKKIMKGFNDHADKFLADVDSKIQEAIEKGFLKLPPPRNGQQPPPPPSTGP